MDARKSSFFVFDFSFNKTENLTIDALHHFDYLLVESTDADDPRLVPYLSRDLKILDFVRGFHGFEMNKRVLFQMRFSPKIYILEQKKNRT